MWLPSTLVRFMHESCYVYSTEEFFKWKLFLQFSFCFLLRVYSLYLAQLNAFDASNVNFLLLVIFEPLLQFHIQGVGLSLQSKCYKILDYFFFFCTHLKYISLLCTLHDCRYTLLAIFILLYYLHYVQVFYVDLFVRVFDFSGYMIFFTYFPRCEYLMERNAAC